MMYGHGKSDSPIVPAKPPNNAVSEAAEAVEERGLAKGKTPKCNMSRTQSRMSMFNALERIRQAVMKDGSERCYHSYSSASLALLPKARAGCSNSARQDPCGGPPVRAVPTATEFNGRQTRRGELPRFDNSRNVEMSGGYRRPDEFDPPSQINLLSGTSVRE